MEAFDVAVVGGGPAGAFTAERLARGGVSTVLLAWPSRDPGRAWQTIAPTAYGMEVLVEGLSAGIPAVAIQGFSSAWGKSRAQIDALLRPDGANLSIQREAAEGWLVRHASAAGVRHVRGRVVASTRKAGLWVLETHDGGSVRARLVIDATGRRASIARKSGARLIRVDRLVATSCLVASPPTAERLVRLESRENGWIISIPAGSGGRLVSSYADAQRQAGQREVALVFHEWFGLEPSTIAWRSTSAATQFLNSAVLPGVIAVGDAAQTRDPLSSGGLQHAFADARSAADAILSQDKDSGEALRRHEDQRRLSLLRYLKLRQTYYGMEDRWRDHAFWFERISGNDARAALLRSGWRP